MHVTTFPDGERQWQISTEGGSQPCWNADGSEVVFRNASFPQKMIVDVSQDPIRFSAPRLLFQADAVGWLNAAGGDDFYGLQRSGVVSRSSFEVWLGWTETLR